MKTNQVICDSNGQRMVTSTTETLRIKASEIQPGDWLLKPHGRVMRKDKLVEHVENNGRQVMAFVHSHAPVFFAKNQMVDVERTL